MRTLEQLTVRNFKSIRDQTLRLGSLNVFIGVNAQESPTWQCFSLSEPRCRRRRSKLYGRSRWRDSILHFGESNHGLYLLSWNLWRVLMPTVTASSFDAAQDRFIFSRESFWYHDRLKHQTPLTTELGGGHVEAKLKTATQSIAHYVRQDLDSYRIYHFHDTSSSAKVKQTGNVNDNRQLQVDAANLAAFLYRLQQNRPGHFQNIEELRRSAPFVERFELNHRTSTRKHSSEVEGERE